MFVMMIRVPVGTFDMAASADSSVMSHELRHAQSSPGRPITEGAEHAHFACLLMCGRSARRNKSMEFAMVISQ
jgi:hypothetical protein